MTFSLNPFVMMKQLLGPKLFNKIKKILVFLLLSVCCYFMIPMASLRPAAPAAAPRRRRRAMTMLVAMRPIHVIMPRPSHRSCRASSATA